MTGGCHNALLTIDGTRYREHLADVKLQLLTVYQRFKFFRYTLRLFHVRDLPDGNVRALAAFCVSGCHHLQDEAPSPPPPPAVAYDARGQAALF